MDNVNLKKIEKLLRCAKNRSYPTRLLLGARENECRHGREHTMAGDLRGL